MAASQLAGTYSQRVQGGFDSLLAAMAWLVTSVRDQGSRLRAECRFRGKRATKKVTRL